MYGVIVGDDGAVWWFPCDDGVDVVMVGNDGVW